MLAFRFCFPSVGSTYSALIPPFWFLLCFPSWFLSPTPAPSLLDKNATKQQVACGPGAVMQRSEDELKILYAVKDRKAQRGLPLCLTCPDLAALHSLGS